MVINWTTIICKNLNRGGKRMCFSSKGFLNIETTRGTVVQCFSNPAVHLNPGGKLFESVASQTPPPEILILLIRCANKELQRVKPPHVVLMCSWLWKAQL